MFWNNCLLVALVAIAGATAENQTLYKPLYQKYSKSTPKFQNVSGADVNPLILALKGHSAGHKSQGGGHHPHFLDKRQSGGNGLGTGLCAPGSPCVNGACCGKTGICGYSPDECGSGNCLSNCDAKPSLLTEQIRISVALAVKLDMEAVALHKSPRVEAALSNVELVIMRAGMQILFDSAGIMN
ncbi:hypothetical protein ACSS6W_008003 [Trichoderma asperelloides]